MFIEVKKLSVDIEKREVIRQLANYCFGEGMKYGVLTNGSVWVLFRAFQEGTTMAERVVWKTDLENDDISAIIRRLNTISKENIENIETLIKKLQILDEIWKSLLDEPKDLAKGFIPVFNDLIKERHPSYEFPNFEIEDFVGERVKELISSTGDTGGDDSIVEHPPPPPTRRMKIGTDAYAIDKWNEVLINTAEWLVRKGKLKRDDCPIPSGHIWNLVNTQPKHRNGKDFNAPKKLSNGLYIETTYNSTNCINNARKLLEKYGYKSDILSVT